jgi:biotin carboxyl carrier protein
MPGTVIAVNCQKQDPIQERQVLMIIEAMKMEHRIEAPFNGEVTDVFFQIGDQVNDGDLLLAIHPTEG